MAQTDIAPTETTRTDVQIGLVIEDQRTGGLRRVVYADSRSVLTRDEAGNTTLTPRDSFELEYGTRYRARRDANPDIDGGQYAALRDRLADHESQSGRKAAHKADALREALDLLAGTASGEFDDGADEAGTETAADRSTAASDPDPDDVGEETVPFEEIPGIGPDTARKLRVQGFVTADDVRGVGDEALLAISGVGSDTVGKIREFVE